MNLFGNNDFRCFDNSWNEICSGHLSDVSLNRTKAGGKTSAKSHAGGGRLWSVTYVMTRQWSQRMFGNESGRGWGSTQPLLVTLRGIEPMMRSKGQRPGLTTVALQTMLTLRTWCVHDPQVVQGLRSRCILPAIHQAPRIRSGALKLVRTIRGLDVSLRRSQTSNQVISNDVSKWLMCPLWQERFFENTKQINTVID